MKRCVRCETVKPEVQFPIDLRRPDGRYPYCLDCKRAYMREYRLADPDRTRENQRTNNIKRHGLSDEQYETMFADQEGRCAICGTDKPGRNHGRLVIDHDHMTGRIRGLLCGDCNNGLGMFGDDIVRLLAAADYLAKHQTQGADIR